MISVTAAQLDAWLAALFFPMVRVLALVATAPVFNNAGLSRRIRLIVGLAITLGLYPALPPLPAISPGSGVGMAILVEQALIGVAMGFTLRLVFGAVDLAGEMIGLQMGLSFAVFYDPQTSAQSSVVAEFLNLIATLVFLAIDGHLMLLMALAKSFSLLPIGGTVLGGGAIAGLVKWGTVVFSSGLMLSLPLIAALLITNIALGVLTRAAPQLNLFAVGFPVTMFAGFSVLLLCLAYMGPYFQQMFELGYQIMEALLGAGAPAALR
jgi:flagellar biosynthesis protein FliR